MARSVEIRTASPIDAPFLITLVGELGYSASSEEMRMRLEVACLDPHYAVFVAESDVIVGWIQIVRTLTLESGFCGEIRGLVVAKTHRELGIGKKLVAAAEKWAASHQCERIRVRTNVTRDDARAFYSKLGYSISKTQCVFDKFLSRTA